MVILGLGVIWAIFKRLENSPCAIHLLQNSYNHEHTTLVDSFKDVAGKS